MGRFTANVTGLRMAAALRKFAAEHEAEFETDYDELGTEHRLVLKRVQGKPYFRFKCGEGRAAFEPQSEGISWKLEWQQPHLQQGLELDSADDERWHAVSSHFMERPLQVNYGVERFGTGIPSARDRAADETEGSTLLTIRDLLDRHRADRELVRSFHALVPLFNNLTTIVLRAPAASA